MMKAISELSVIKITKINALLIATYLLLIASCSETDRSYSISGTLDNGAGKKLYLYEMSTYELIPVDSFIVDDYGKFRFQGEIAQIRFMSLRENQLNYLTLIVTPGESIQITADYNNLPETSIIKGSPESKLAAEISKKMHSTIMNMDSLGSLYRESLTQHETDIDNLRDKIRSDFEKIAEDQRQFTIDFITRNPGSLASLMALYQQIDPNTFVLRQKEDFKYYTLVDSVLFAKHPDLEYAITLNENVREMTSQIELRKQKESLLADGSIAPEISLPDPKGNTINLSSLRGNYVLLDFWAAWCGPCRQENPYLVETYHKYNPKGFEIYQVSLDRNRESWLRGIEEDKLDRWTHVSDLQFWSSVVVPLYQIDGIPANFLLDPDGRIIARNLRGDELLRTLAEIFN